MDLEWQQWLLHQHDAQGLNCEQILRQAIYYNALNSSGFQLTHDHTPTATVTQWNGLDSELNYNRHLADPQQRRMLESHGWIDAPIHYELNSWGFRSQGCAEFDTITEPSLVAMGCSFTFGTGLPQNTIWPQLSADGLDLRLVNLGTPGHGLAMNTQWLLTQGHTLKDPRAVVIFMPPPGRMTWYQSVPADTKSGDHIVGNTFSMGEWNRSLNIHKNLLYNAHMDYVKNYAAIQLWCDHRRIPVLVFTDALGVPGLYGLARDLAHHGRGWHRALAQRVIERVKNS